MLTAADFALHAQLGIEPDVLEQLQVRRVDDLDARATLGLTTRVGRLDGVLYPYLVPGQAHPVTHRLRRDHPELEQGGPKNKYVSAYGDHRHLYFATVDPALLSDAIVPVIVAEAEKSALAIACAPRRQARSILPIGLGGCWGWRGRIGKAANARGVTVDEVGPLPDLGRIKWTDRDTILAFDANAASQPAVQAARRALARELASRGAQVRILSLPVEEGINGPDDYLGRHGDAAFFTLVDAALDVVTFDVMFRLNAIHAVVPEAGKTIVITEEWDPVLERQVLQRSTFADFRNRYLNESVDTGRRHRNGEPIRVPLGHFWLAHPDRRQYAGIVMSPSRSVPDYLNLWRGFAVEPQPGTWTRLRDHVEHVICQGDPEVFAYVLAWLAHCVQHPDRQPEVALALRGPRGTGKGIFARSVGSLFGQHYLQIANARHLTGNFNSHLQDCIVLFADEAFWAGDKAGESVLKMLITEPVIPIERKGRDLVLVPNLLHLMLASNADWVVPAGMDERRFCVLDVTATHQQDHAYFSALLEELKHGGRAGLLYDLLHYDLSTVNLRAAPVTEALRHQKVLSLQPAERWLFDKLMAGQWRPDHDEWQTVIPKEALHEDYVQCLQRIGIDRRSTETELGMFISKIFGSEVQITRRIVDGKRCWCWTVSNLEACRLAFDLATQSQHPWPKDD